MSDTNIVFPPHSTSSPGYDRFATLVTACDLRNLYLWGCKLENSLGVTIPDEVITHHILSAISFIEHTLNTTITPTDYIENQDFRAQDYSSWCILNLQHTPIIEVTKISVKFIKSSTTVDYPTDWYRVMNLAGQVMLTPTAGTLGSWSLGMGGVMLLPTGFLSRNDFPQLFEITYKAGFEQDKVPFIINSLVARWACLNILAILGNVIIAPGVAGYSIGLDGVSQSVSKLPNPYMVLAQQHMDAFNAELQIAKSFYKRVNLQVS